MRPTHKMLVIAAAVLVGYVLAPQIARIPVVNKLPQF